jgi:hypothetical protein
MAMAGSRGGGGMTTRLDTALTDVQAFIAKYVCLTDAQLIACALWVAHTYVVDAADVTPYISITSAEKQSGKTVLLDVFDAIVWNPWRAVRPSEAVVFRKIEADRPTLLLDEVDTIWGPKSKAEDEGLRALLNAGFRRLGSTVPRCVGPSMHLRDFSTYCPKALAGIGDLPDTVADRSIPIRMTRKRRSDNVQRFRLRAVEIVAGDVRDMLREIVAPLVDDLIDAEPILPDELSDRAQDACEPLLAIADPGGW